MFCEHFKDTHAALNGALRCFDKSTAIETDNEVILKTLSSLCTGEKTDAVRAVRFLPLTAAEKEKTERTFGAVWEEKEDMYLLEVLGDTVTVYANELRGFLYGACTLREHYRDGGIREGYIYNVPLVQFRAVKMYLPAEDKLDEFYYMLDMFMHYGYNALVIEVKDTFVATTINHRYITRLPTLISSERTPMELLEIDEATGSRIIETVTGVTEIPLTVTGSSIRFFFLRSGSFLPLVACVELQKSQ